MVKTTWAKMDDWVKVQLKRIDHMATMVPARIIEEQQRSKRNGGNMPVKTGALQDSLVVIADGKTFIGKDAYLGLIGLMGVKSIQWGWTVQYDMRMNYGFTGFDSLDRYYNQPGNHFIEYGMLQKAKIVEEEAAYARSL